MLKLFRYMTIPIFCIGKIERLWFWLVSCEVSFVFVSSLGTSLRRAVLKSLHGMWEFSNVFFNNNWRLLVPFFMMNLKFLLFLFLYSFNILSRYFFFLQVILGTRVMISNLLEFAQGAILKTSSAICFCTLNQFLLSD